MSIETAFMRSNLIADLGSVPASYFALDLWIPVDRRLVYPSMKGILQDVSQSQVMQVECCPDALRDDRVLIRRKR